jgi:hypothetical protein
LQESNELFKDILDIRKEDSVFLEMAPAIPEMTKEATEDSPAGAYSQSQGKAFTTGRTYRIVGEKE